VAEQERWHAGAGLRPDEVGRQAESAGDDLLVHALPSVGKGPIIVGAVTSTGAPAFKEWAVVVQALLQGEQILDVRKGGIREDGRHFSVQATRLWLYPTAEHQRPELLKPAYAGWVERSVATAPADRSIVISGWADVVGVATVTDADVLEALEGKVIWSHEYVESRFSWKRRDPLWVLALRAHRLAEPITVPWRDGYGGCTSWVDLDGLPDDPASLASEPALSDTAFAARLKGAADAIPGGFAKPDAT
jgi:hypothetical protein